MVAAISFQAAAITSGSSTSRTLSFTVASAAGQERLVALSAIANATPATVTFTSVAIDGQSATLVGTYARATDGLGNGSVVAFFRAAGTANTSINVTCTISTGAVFDCRGAVWSLNDAGSLLASTTDTAAGVGNIGSLDLNANTVIDGAAAAFVLAYACSTRNITWSGLTERADGSTPLYSGDWHSAADLNVGSSSTPLTITATLPTTFDSNSAVAGVAVSFNPAEAGTDGGGVSGQQIIDIGDAINDGTGDPARVAFDKCNANFTELYTADTVPQEGWLTYIGSATQLKFSPFNGNKIKINGTIFTIPNAGIAGLTNTGAFVNGTGSSSLAANTTYWIYAFSNAGVVTADFRTASTHATSTTAGNEGVEILTGNDTRTLIGLCRTNASSQFADTATQRFVRSWFNPEPQNFTNGFTAARSTASASFVELNTEIRCEFVTWAIDIVTAALVGYSYNGAPAYAYSAVGWDGAATVVGAANIAAANYGSTGGSVGVSESKKLSEGYHYITYMGASSSGTSNFGVGVNALSGRVG